MMAPLRLFATLWDSAGGRCRILCDGRQHFLFERTWNGVLVERFHSGDPDCFHRYVNELGARGWTFAWAPREGG
ncbi:MAG TPA: hypothetical protein VFH75_03350 [Actinomycetota bacterium]|nr:hypothetical protein [Actinomycetota bacterium]